MAFGGVGAMFGSSVVRSFKAAVKPQAPLYPKAPQVPAGQRVYAIGDVHGCADLLEDLHRQIDAHIKENSPARVTVVHLGDYVDRGPASRRVIETLASPSIEGATFVNLKGNHEALLLEFLEQPETGAGWLRVGGVETISSYGVDVAGALRMGGCVALAQEFARALPDTHGEFLTTLSLSASVGDYFFCHAGIRPGVPLECQEEDDLIWIRDAFTASRIKFGKMIVHGHTPVRSPELHSNRIAIDTEAYKSGRLSCLILEGTEQSLLST